MSRNKLNVLIVDDHPLIIEAYKNVLEKLNFDSSIETFMDIDSTLFKLKDKEYLKSIDLIFLDIKLPPSSNKLIVSGEGLGTFLQENGVEAKMIIATTLNDNFRLYSILKNVDPDGLLVKNDLTSDELLIAIDSVLNNIPYYSKSVLQLMRKQISNDFILDNIDRRLLYELSLGTKMKELPEVLPLSIAGIERRKRNLKMLFNVENQGDKELVLIAKEKGFI